MAKIEGLSTIQQQLRTVTITQSLSSMKVGFDWLNMM